MNKKFTKEAPGQVLNIGTRILVKDVMDQYLRTLGEVKTYYASKLSSAIESYKDRQPTIIFCEHTFPEGGALEFIEAIGGLDTAADRYFVLAVESAPDELVALAMEKCIDEILVKPFSTDNILQIMERALDKRAAAAGERTQDLRAAKKSLLEKRFQEAEELYGAAAKKYWNDSGTLLDCAEFFVNRNQPQKAMPLLEKVVQDSPENVRALHLQGCALRRLGRLAEAARALQKASMLSPLNTQRNVELADTYAALAEEQITGALKVDPESSSLILRRAQFQFLKREFGPLVTYLDSKKTYLSEAAKKDAEAYITLAKKLAGLR